MSTGLLPGLTAVILCGGESRRMGRPKHALVAAGKTLLAHMIEGVRPLATEVLIVGKAPPDDLPGGVGWVADERPEQGALVGIVSGLRAASNEWVWMLACDMAPVDPALLKALRARRAGVQAVLPRTARGLEPFGALYHRSAAHHLDRCVRQGRLGVVEAVSGLNHAAVGGEDLGLAPGLLPAFPNANTPEEFETMRRRLDGTERGRAPDEMSLDPRTPP